MTAATTGPTTTRHQTDTLELGALPSAVPSARLHTRLILCEWQLHDLADDAEHVVAEVITNAIEATHAAGLHTPVRLTLIADHASVLIVAWDAVPIPPTPTGPRADADSESGRGLLIVESLSAWWDCKPVPAERGGGKLVRAMIIGSPHD